MGEFSKGCYVALSVSLFVAAALEHTGHLIVNYSALSSFLGL